MSLDGVVNDERPPVVDGVSVRLVHMRTRPLVGVQGVDHGARGVPELVAALSATLGLVLASSRRWQREQSACLVRLL